MARGVRCVAAPIFVFPGQVAAAIGIAGPAARISRQMLERLARPLIVSVRQLSGRLAHPLGCIHKAVGGVDPVSRTSDPLT